MSLLVTADLHFTDNPRDAHRWDLLPWLAKQAQKHKAEAMLLLGDLTDAKDKHSAALTNRMVQGLHELAQVVPVYIIRGNHDYIDENEPFFGFVNAVYSDTSNSIRFLTKPTTVKFRSMGTCLLLPNTRNWEKDWNEFGWENTGPGAPKFIFTHQTFDGCLTENGTRLDGIPPSVFNRYSGKVWSGDIHKPQKVGRNIEYVGAPYRCRFGDDYEPRVLLLNDDGTTKDLHFPTKNKVLVELDGADLDDAVREFVIIAKNKLYEGDQVKVRVVLPRTQYAEWPRCRALLVEAAAGLGLELTGPELVAKAVVPSAKTQAKADAVQALAGPEAAVVAYATLKGAAAPLKTSGLTYLKQATASK